MALGNVQRLLLSVTAYDGSLWHSASHGGTRQLLRHSATHTAWLDIQRRCSAAHCSTWHLKAAHSGISHPAATHVVPRW